MIEQAIRVEDIKWGDVYLEDVAEEACPLEAVRGLKRLHRSLGGMAVYLRPEDKSLTLAACHDAVRRVEARLARVKTQLQEEPNGNNGQIE